jgi:YD repeat-containing protein
MRSWLFPIITYAFLSVMLAFTGCKKISSVNGTVSSYTEAKTIAGVTVNTMTTLSYDGQGRLIMMATTNDTPTSYAYAPNTVIKTTVVRQKKSGEAKAAPFL